MCNTPCLASAFHNDAQFVTGNADQVGMHCSCSTNSMLTGTALLVKVQMMALAFAQL